MPSVETGNIKKRLPGKFYGTFYAKNIEASDLTITAIKREQKYYFKFLSPTSYGIFFKTLRERTYGDFKLEIDARLTG
ncbi:MAG: hypothetical protein Q8P28_07025 [Deltaproteobacteria bacterium]|nr:hypothetical protein [Deltaproteobacteria bacterium]